MASADAASGWEAFDTAEETLEEAFNLTPEESRAMGDRGRSLIMETYASPQVAASMKRLYRYLLGQEPKPEFVDLS